MKPKLSIIVPVYKVESYLRKCVDSLLRQDLLPEAYEIILVDDGSPDHCGDICDDYAAKHSNVVALHRENGGLLSARRLAVREAAADPAELLALEKFLARAEDYLRANLGVKLVTGYLSTYLYDEK